MSAVFKAEMYITRMVAKAPKSTNDSRLKKILRLEMSNFIHSEAFMVSKFQKRLVLARIALKLEKKIRKFVYAVVSTR